MQCEFSDLNVLLKASSKVDVIQICREAFLYRNKPVLSDNVLNMAIDKLGSDRSTVAKLYKSLSVLLKMSVFHGSSDPKFLLKLYPSDFQKNLKELLIKITIDNMSSWKSIASASQVSLPNLVDFDWRVDVKTSSDSIARMSVPTCILNMQVQETATDVNSMPDVNGVQVELSKETLDTMLDGLSKIRDQLNSVANR
ncbi:hypothetical protein SNE40_007020 [Patella caerulea]|uniref:COMM domain-containing protein n=1 Tax=Patella caerulea TaxID=87958 RepID=A0AAN8PT73_PATCE